jgi:hypothetical protein
MGLYVMVTVTFLMCLAFCSHFWVVFLVVAHFLHDHLIWRNFLAFLFPGLGPEFLEGLNRCIELLKKLGTGYSCWSTPHFFDL